MKPYIIIHMMTSIDGRIDCSMLEHLSSDEYYVALEQLGPCSQLSGRQTAALEWPAVKEGTSPMGGNPIAQESVLGNYNGKLQKRTDIPSFASPANKYPKVTWKA